MPIVFCGLDIYLSGCRSLKEKRNILRKTAGRLRARFNFSISEIDHHDLWQRSRLGAVSIGPDRRKLEEISGKLIEESERILGGDLIGHEIEFFEYD